MKTILKENENQALANQQSRFLPGLHSVFGEIDNPVDQVEGPEGQRKKDARVFVNNTSCQRVDGRDSGALLMETRLWSSGEPVRSISLRDRVQPFLQHTSRVQRILHTDRFICDTRTSKQLSKWHFSHLSLECRPERKQCSWCNDRPRKMLLQWSFLLQWYKQTNTTPK